MIKILDNIKYQGKEYTYVDKFIYNKMQINCYLGDEEYLFTYIKDEKEIFIKDKDLINAIKEQEGLNNPEIYYSSQNIKKEKTKDIKKINPKKWLT